MDKLIFAADKNRNSKNVKTYTHYEVTFEVILIKCGFNVNKI